MIVRAIMILMVAIFFAAACRPNVINNISRIDSDPICSIDKTFSDKSDEGVIDYLRIFSVSHDMEFIAHRNPYLPTLVVGMRGGGLEIVAKNSFGENDFSFWVYADDTESIYSREICDELRTFLES